MALLHIKEHALKEGLQLAGGDEAVPAGEAGEVEEPSTPRRSRSRSPDQADVQHADILGHVNQLKHAGRIPPLSRGLHVLPALGALPASGICCHVLPRVTILKLTCGLAWSLMCQLKNLRSDKVIACDVDESHGC